MAQLRPARTAGGTPAAWKTPYRLYDERRTVSSASSSTGQGAAPTRTASDPAAVKTASPSPSALADAINVRGISIAGWRIETHRGSIADSKTIDELSDTWGIPLPEMPFDKNRLVIRYEGQPNGGSGILAGNPSISTSGVWEYCFDGLSALRAVEGVRDEAALHGLDLQSTSADRGVKTKTGGALGEKPAGRKRVQVAYANEWGKKRDQSGNAAPSPSQTAETGGMSNFGPEVARAAASGSIATARDFDWTYSSTWPGAETHTGDDGSRTSFIPATDPARDRIPIERLGPPPMPGAQAEPILFFDDLILFEDELGDNGTSLLNVKVRIMPTGFLVLQRFFLRVDNVVFRVFDTRMYVSFYADDDEEQQQKRAETLTAASSSSQSDRHIESAQAGLSGLSLGTARRPQASLGQPVPASPLRVIRECSGRQERYADVRACLPPYKSNDLSLLTDPGWVAQQLAKMDEERRRKRNAMAVSSLDGTARSTGLHPWTMVSTDQIDPTRPAVVPSMNMPGQESNRILGEINDHDEKDVEERWEGEGQRVDVALLY